MEFGPLTAVAATYRGREGMEAFAPAVGAALVAQRLRIAAPASFAARLTALPAAGGASLVRVRVPALTAERTVGDAGGGGSVFVMFPERAWGVLEHARGRVEVRPGVGLVIPSSSPFAVSYRSTAVITFCELPASIAASRYGLHEGPVSAFDVDAVSGELLKAVAALEAAARRSLAASAPAPRDDLRRLTGVLIDALLSGRNGPDPTTLRVAATRVLESALDDPSLDAGAVARQLGVSTRTLHRAFENGPTLLQELTRLRLDRAVGVLTARPERSVSEVAHACGFGSHSRFSAVFREQFGSVPSTWRKSASAAAQSG